MVWIHGGSFTGDSGAEAIFSGESFARQGVMLVTINYRLGNLGHFAFPALSAEHPEEPKGYIAYPSRCGYRKQARQRDLTVDEHLLGEFCQEWQWTGSMACLYFGG